MQPTLGYMYVRLIRLYVTWMCDYINMCHVSWFVGKYGDNRWKTSYVLKSIIIYYELATLKI